MMTSALALCLAGGAMASDADRLAALEELVRRQGERIAVLEQELEERDVSEAVQPTAVTPVAVASTPPASPSPTIETPSRLAVSGDLRLRQEFNWGADDAPDRTRNSLRARLAARYALTDRVTLGARMVTGNADDPNSTDVTIGNFVDDFELSLDQAYTSVKLGGFTLTGGKFANPFARTDLVWDGDVNPQGIALAYRADLSPGLQLDARALHFAIEENVAGNGSAMNGAQLGFTIGDKASWQFAVTGGYYDYRLGSLDTADAGDFRTNQVAIDGRYVSSFELAEVLGSLTYGGLGEKWPVRGTLDYVKNLGASDDVDTGWLAQVTLGTTGHAGDWELWYVHSSVDADAVFAALTQDNIPLATNYLLQAGGASYSLGASTRIEVMLYHYRVKREVSGLPAADWQDRARINLVFGF